MLEAHTGRGLECGLGCGGGGGDGDTDADGDERQRLQLEIRFPCCFFGRNSSWILRLFVSASVWYFILFTLKEFRFAILDLTVRPVHD